ncbi:MAG: gamma-glutamyl-gamma-aminobutyrate hydrolase family protein, partial [Gemmatimonadota bacterium]
MSAFVAVTATIDPEGGLYNKPMIALYANYVRVLERSGLSCALVTPAHAPRSIRRLLAASCGLVLTGGEDLDPAHYGEDPHPELGLVNRGRDEMEYRALDAALSRGMPVLGLCRGHQLLNVYFGGTLFQNIETEMPSELLHRHTEWGEHHH